MRSKALGVVALLALAASVHSQDDAAKKDLKGMEGTWDVALVENDGKKVDDEKKQAAIKLVVKNAKYTIYFQGKKLATGQIKLDATKKPRQIDAIAEDGPTKGKAMKGVYELKGDEMRVCFAQPGGERPTEFRTREGTQQVLITYKRRKE
jgi:uncharacterized protein (TIGR03067 family)